MEDQELKKLDALQNIKGKIKITQIHSISSCPENKILYFCGQPSKDIHAINYESNSLVGSKLYL